MISLLLLGDLAVLPGKLWRSVDVDWLRSSLGMFCHLLVPKTVCHFSQRSDLSCFNRDTDLRIRTTGLRIEIHRMPTKKIVFLLLAVTYLHLQKSSKITRY